MRIIGQTEVEIQDYKHEIMGIRVYSWNARYLTFDYCHDGMELGGKPKRDISGTGGHKLDICLGYSIKLALAVITVCFCSGRNCALCFQQTA